jgi:hypothetical protein
MSTTRKATDVGGARDVVGTPRISYEAPMSSNRPETPSLADRRAELKALVHLAFQRCAEVVIKRSWYSAPKDETRTFLYDAARGRRPANEENIARVIAHGGADELSEALYQIGRRQSPAPCLSEATLKETQANGPLDEVQLLLEREGPTKARLEQARERIMAQFQATRDLLDAVTHKLQKVS